MILISDLLPFLESFDWKPHAFHPACYVRPDGKGGRFYLKNPVGNQFQLGRIGMKGKDKQDLSVLFSGCVNDLDTLGFIIDRVEKEWDGEESLIGEEELENQIEDLFSVLKSEGWEIKEENLLEKEIEQGKCKVEFWGEESEARGTVISLETKFSRPILFCGCITHLDEFRKILHAVLEQPEQGDPVIPVIPPGKRPRTFAKNPLMSERKIKPLLFRWERILKKRHPEYFATLNGWTNSFELDEVERELEIIGLPGTFRASLSMFNGQQEDTPFGVGPVRLFSAAEILQRHAAMVAYFSKDRFLSTSEEHAWGTHSILHAPDHFKHWVPFGQINLNWLYIDLAPNEAGTPGQIVEVYADAEHPIEPGKEPHEGSYLTIGKTLVGESYEDWFEKVLIPAFL